MDEAIRDALKTMQGVATYDHGRVRLADPKRLRGPATDRLVRLAVFGESAEERDAARWLVWELAQEAGCGPASIHDLYMAMGRGEVQGFTVPAMNVRMMAYDTARAIFRAANARKVGALICELARSEMAYTDQRPAEYATVILGAALREGFRGPVFVQGDHFQANAKKFQKDAEAELDAIRALIDEAVPAGFFNIDIDTSTLVDLSQKTLDAQQRENYERAAELTHRVRAAEPEGVTISVGGEIGEVGGKNSTVEELRAFIDGYNAALDDGEVGISKISVQTGTSHGGVVRPDGSIADVKLDLDALKSLSKAARDEYGLGGAVQHGASTLPDDAFGHFPACGACEIHLATNFQNIIYDHEAFPEDVRHTLREWVFAHCADERKASDTDEQFFYKSRKKAIGPHKRLIWDLPETVRSKIAADLEKAFGFLFEQLRVVNTADVVAKHITPPTIRHAEPHAVAVAAPDDADAGE